MGPITQAACSTRRGHGAGRERGHGTYRADAARKICGVLQRKAQQGSHRPAEGGVEDLNFDVRGDVRGLHAGMYADFTRHVRGDVRGFHAGCTRGCTRGSA